MKLYAMMTFAGISFTFVGCTETLQQISRDHRAQRMSETYANKPVEFGAADGLGAYNAQAARGTVALDETNPR